MLPDTQLLYTTSFVLMPSFRCSDCTSFCIILIKVLVKVLLNAQKVLLVRLHSRV